MDYEKKYKDANNKVAARFGTNVAKEIFADLYESEDEMIRKEIINYFKCQSREEPSRKDIHNKWIAWLEKQGTPAKLSEEEQNRFAKGVLKSCALSFINYLDAHKYEGKMCVSNGECEDIENAFRNAMWNRLHRYYCKYIEKQGEQKSTDKVESKFKIGDWIIKNDGKDCFSDGSYVLKITDIDDISYKLSNGCYLTEPFINTYRLWTIQDAKDGDILETDFGIGIFKEHADSYNAYCYCYYNNEDGLVVSNNELLDEYQATPATKEQRELLFQKMKEAGYEWNADKKVLVTVGIDNDKEDEQYEELMEDDETNIKQNPAWSDDDKKMVERISNIIDTNYAGFDWKRMISWLKSLKDRVQPKWKPTDEQLMALRDAIDNNEMESLYNDLKKL